jgi:uncharacterized membrane protein YcaP (DUF421 family)
MPDMMFESFGGLGRVLIVGAFAYVALVGLLLATGKRTLSKMNAFDLVVTIALGSALSTTMLSKSTPLAEGVLGLALLVLLQFAVTWLAVRWKSFEQLVKSTPTLLVHRGAEIQQAMRRERITSDEIMAAIRASGRTGLDESISVVLETDGSLSVFGARRAEGSRDAAGRDGKAPDLASPLRSPEQLLADCRQHNLPRPL